VTILNDVMNENLKLLQINYVAHKVDVLFCSIFLLGHKILVTELMARLCSFFWVMTPSHNPKELQIQSQVAKSLEHKFPYCL